jgi:hypothetical protein
MTFLSHLKSLAQAATPGPPTPKRDIARSRFDDAATPETVLALLDVIEAAKELAELKRMKDTPYLKMTAETERRRLDYEKRKPIAWAALDAALAHLEQLP